MRFIPDDIDIKDIYRLLISAISPRPIAWVSTINNRNQVNLAPFSFFNIASVNPPILGFSPLLNQNREAKDTLNNIKENKEFVINIVSHLLTEQMNQTSFAYDQSVNEMQETGLSSIAAATVRPPAVKESKIYFECKLYDIIEFGNQPLSGNLVLGKVSCISIDDAIYKNDHIDTALLDTIGRAEGTWYTTTRDRFSLERPSSKKS